MRPKFDIDQVRPGMLIQHNHKTGKYLAIFLGKFHHGNCWKICWIGKINEYGSWLPYGHGRIDKCPFTSPNWEVVS